MQNNHNGNPWVMITGTNRGIGRATLECFSERGWNVLAHARAYSREFEGDCNHLSCRYGVSVSPIYFDLSDTEKLKESIMGVLKSGIEIDALVNSAGMAKFRFFPMMGMKEIREVFEVNLFAQMQISQILLSKWIRRKSGAIVNVCSIAGFDLNTNNAAYGVSKAALIAFTRELSMETGQFNIRVNGVAPGIVDTDMVEISGEKNYDELVHASAMSRAASPSEIANVIYWLCSREASYVNGQVIRVDGGMI